MFTRTLLLTASMVLLVACAPADLLTINVPSNTFTVEHGIRYEAGERHTLDIYRPVSVAPGKPVIVFFYGGEWRYGRKEDVKFVAEPLAAAGITVVVPDYRLSPEVTFPAFVDDGAAAVAWTRKNIAQYGGAAKNMFVMGHSAGAYIAVMLATNSEYLARAGMSRNDLAGGIGIAGPYNFLPITWPELKPIFEVVPDQTVTQPITFVDGKAPPMLLVAGQADDTVNPMQNTDAMYHKIVANHGMASEILYPDVGHIGIVVAFSPLLRDKAPVFADTLGFVQANTTP